MSERAQRQADAERAVRRGELKEGLAIYRALLAEDPEDPAVRARIATIESLLQPQELTNLPPAPASPPPAIDLARSATLEQTAELLFERGDVAGALATYERVLKERPDHDLARERHHELQRLFGASAARPPMPKEPPLPLGKPELLEALLARISTRRKP